MFVYRCCRSECFPKLSAEIRFRAMAHCGLWMGRVLSACCFYSLIVFGVDVLMFAFVRVVCDLISIFFGIRYFSIQWLIDNENNLNKSIYHVIQRYFLNRILC